MRVRYTLEAQEHLASIFSHISEDNPAAASRVVKRIRDAAGQIGEFPQIGHSGRVPSTRERRAPGLPYIIVYEIHVDQHEILILGVFHGAQDR